MIFVGPLKPMGHRISRRFKVAYAVHDKGRTPAIFKALGAEREWSHDLHSGMVGVVYTVPPLGWESPTGLQLQKDPIDG